MSSSPRRYWTPKRVAISTAVTAALGFALLFLGEAFAGEPAKPPAAGGGFTFGDWIERLSPILILLAVIVLVLVRLPKIDLGHSPAYRRRRVMNWLPMGLTYAFLYMGRYNLNVAKTAFGDAMPLDDFSIIFAIGTITYGCSFLINGPLADKFGGKLAILIGAAGSAVCNFAMGWYTVNGAGDDMLVTFSVLYALNMYFQSFGAVAIVKVNAPWFHVNERGVFGAIFGILISLGVYFAFDVSGIILEFLSVEWVFFMPACLLAVFWVIDFIVVKNTPGEAGFDDFDTADASSGDDGPRLPVKEVFVKMLTNPVILTIACIEFCSGYLRQAIMQYYRPFVKALKKGGEEVDPMLLWVFDNWGLLLCCAGIMGGVFAGVISDRVFNSRRGPVSAVLYGLMVLGSIVGIFIITTPLVGWLVIFMSMCIIGVHGMLSGTASMDFGGKKNVGVAVGIIDGFVYLGTAVMAGVFAIVLPSSDIDPATGMRFDSLAENWIVWPIAMVPLSVIGLLLSRKIWNAKPKAKAKAAGS